MVRAGGPIRVARGTEDRGGPGEACVSEPAALWVRTHGDTYEEALRRGVALTGLLVEPRRERGEFLPAQRVFAASAR